MVSKYMRTFTLILVLFLTSSLCNAQTKIDWNRDLDSLAIWLPQKHYNLFMYRNEESFSTGITELKKDVARCSDLQMILKLQQFIVKFGDAHTNVNYIVALSPNRVYPMGLACYGTDYFITTTTTNLKNLLGSRLIAINGHPINKIEKQFSSLIVTDSRSCVLNTVPNIMAYSQIYEYFNLAKGDSIVITYNKNGNVKKKVLKAGPINPKSLINIIPAKKAMHLENNGSLFTETYLPEDKIYYIQYNKCWSRELENKYGYKDRAALLPSFKEFTERIFTTLAEKDIKKIVFDLRYNSGGSSQQFTELVKQLSTVLQDKDKIKCYAITGRSTFSSGILNSLDLKKYLNATFVGEETAGCANHLGEIRGFRLPTSKIEISYSTKYFTHEGIDDGPIVPDIVKQSTFEDFMNGIDPVLEWIKQQ